MGRFNQKEFTVWCAARKLVDYVLTRACAEGPAPADQLLRDIVREARHVRTLMDEEERKDRQRDKLNS
jgi:hypothetical protein